MPEPIRSNVPGSFSESVLLHRHPAIIRQVRSAHPYPPEILAALDRLLDELAAGRIEPLVDGASDGTKSEYIAQRWLDVPFLAAEGFFYRKLLDAVGFFAPGPWRGIDPFEPRKSAALAVLDLPDPPNLTDFAELSPQELLYAALWGNRADLGFHLARRPGDTVATTADGADLAADILVDDSAAMWHHLDAAPGGRVCLVADNAGAELLPDLVLVDHLLRSGRAEHVELHLKPYPIFVSDATTADLLAVLARVSTSDLGRRLWSALNDGRLSVETHPFHCAPLSYHEMPADLATRFAAARLTILKGDLNYRRLVGDLHWPATASFQELTAYFPGPLVALRTIKSDVVVGLPPPTLATLEATTPGWRTTGTHALIQLTLRPVSR